MMNVNLLVYQLLLLGTCLLQCHVDAERKVCPGTNNGMSYTDSGDRYVKYRNKYNKCVVINGNLEIVSLLKSDANYNMSFLEHIEEVTGYVLIARVYARSLPLTNLRIIRGKTLYENPEGSGQKFALYIGGNYDKNSQFGLQELQLNSLTEIASGGLFIKANRLLCNVDSIDWTQILSASNATEVIESNADPDQCPACNSTCEGRCWTQDICQIPTKNCSAKCSNQCFGPRPYHCCHSECARGCTGPKDSQCFACRKYKDENRCVSQCPPTFIYNSEKQKNEPNPDAKFIYKSQCVKECPAHMSAEFGACVTVCQSGNEPGPNETCMPCNGICPKDCDGVDDIRWIDDKNIESFRHCIRVRGNIRIQETTFRGDEHYDIPPLKLDQLSALEHVEQIGGYLLVDAKFPGFTNLSFLRNLKVIQGQRLYGGIQSLRIRNTSLESLGLDSLRAILNGAIFIKYNSELCFVESMNWNKMFEDESQTVDLNNNRNATSCEEDGLVCSDQCIAADGCMGLGHDQCLYCSNVQFGRICLDRCSEHEGVLLYDRHPNDTEHRQCGQCHSECIDSCTGPEPDDCSRCRNVQIGSTCVASEATQSNDRRDVAIIVGVLTSGCLFLGIVVVLVLLLRRQLAKAEEKKLQLTAKINGVVECEPLTPSDAKPDMAVLRLIKESDLKRRNVIGSGAFGTVYKGFWVPEDDNVKIPVAIKVLHDGSGQNDSLLEEARIMASVDHPCCVRILAVCMTAQMMLITQLMPLGCLLDYVRKNREKIGSKALLNWCTQIARGMSYLEDRAIIHRDLAARNVLVQNPHHVKITDFGLAKVVTDHGSFRSSGGKWPIKWLALESIQHQVFTHKSDVWSFGVTVWELCTFGRCPYEGISTMNVLNLLEKGERLPQPPICTIDVYMIMIKCWVIDADSRPSFAELVTEFAKMARDPARYLVVQDDGVLQLASQPLTTKDIISFMSLDSSEGVENIISGDDYINNFNRRKSSQIQDYDRPPKAKSDVEVEKKLETTPLLRLNIPRRSANLGLSDPGPESPRYSPDPSSIAQPLSFQRPTRVKSKAFNTTDRSCEGAAAVSSKDPPPSLVQSENSSEYLNPVMSSGIPNYLVLENESDTEDSPSVAVEDTTKVGDVKMQTKPDTDKTSSHSPAIVVTNPEYYGQDSIGS